MLDVEQVVVRSEIVPLGPNGEVVVDRPSLGGFQIGRWNNEAIEVLTWTALEDDVDVE